MVPEMLPALYQAAQPCDLDLQDKESKLAYLQKMIDFVSTTLSEPVVAKPAKVPNLASNTGPSLANFTITPILRVMGNDILRCCRLWLGWSQRLPTSFCKCLQGLLLGNSRQASQLARLQLILFHNGDNTQSSYDQMQATLSSQPLAPQAAAQAAQPPAAAQDFSAPQSRQSPFEPMLGLQSEVSSHVHHLCNSALCLTHCGLTYQHSGGKLRCP